MCRDIAVDHSQRGCNGRTHLGVEQIVEVLVIVAVDANAIQSDLNVLHLAVFESMLLAKRKYAVDGRMIVAAARIGLEVRALDLVALADSKEHPVPLHFAVRVDVAEAIAAFEHLGRTRDAAPRELCAEQPIARRLSGMDALDFRAVVEVLADATRETAGEAERVLRLVCIEPEKLA